MSDTVFQVVLPLFWLWLVVGVAANRWHVRRRLGREPVVIRPLTKADTPARYLERTLSMCTVVLTADIAMNAISAETIAGTLAIGPLRTSSAVGYVGLTLLTIGFFLATLAVRQMGMSWRIGIDHTAPGPVISRGVFSLVRHPIYSGMLLATTGVAALTADLLSVAVAATTWVGLPVQARLEEAFLLSQYPQEYADYMKQTGRFWPKIRHGGRRRNAR